MDALENMTLGELVAKIAGCLTAISVVVQISPMKLNPWTKMLGWLGRMINKEVIEKIDALEVKVQSVEDDLGNVKHAMGESGAKDARARILRFADEILHGVRHSKERYDEVLLDITEYEDYCKNNPDFKNQMTKSNTKVIVNKYEECLRNHDFLDYVVENE